MQKNSETVGEILLSFLFFGQKCNIMYKVVFRNE